MNTTCADNAEIFWASGSPFAWRVLLAAELNGIGYVSRRLRFDRREHKAPDYLALNPRGEVPTLRDGAYVLTESLAIMVYLDSRQPEPRLFGDRAETAGRIWQGIATALTRLEPLADRVVLPAYRGIVAADLGDIREAARALHDEWAALERTLSLRPWLAAETVSAADLVSHTDLEFFLRIAARPRVRALDLGFDDIAATYPAIAAWRDRLRALPGYDAAYPPHWRDA